ncbi:MAG TPA: GH116 family glycosyl hydrolase [Pyrinomonadaceae bacterium]
MAAKHLPRLVCCLCLCLYVVAARAQTPPPAPPPPPTPPAPGVAKFALRRSGLELERAARAGAFYAVTGRRAAAFGYEHRALEAWVYPLKLLDGFELSFKLAGYPLELRGADTLVRVTTRPEATVFTYAHAAFTVRQIVFAPLDEPGVVMLLDVESALPLTISVSFRPRLRLAWPAGLMTGGLSWDEDARAYFLTEETKRYVGVVGSPAARDVSVQPYQEEPRDVPARFTIEPDAAQLKTQYIPIVIAGSTEGRDKAQAAYARLLANVPALYEQTVAHYERLQNETLAVTTPDARLNEAFAWAKVGVDKGVVTNPALGTGLVAGYRTSGESERPGFAWFFGRDALWTAYALDAYGDYATTRAALTFLKKFQRADGKIPHEISQSAALIPWFTDYEYPWASADATPLYVLAHADLYRATGDRAFLAANWDSILKAYRFTEATDTDANGLIENTKFGHGWVEGGALYPPHEEIYMQGLWVAAAQALAELAGVMGDAALATRARANAARTSAATERTYWLPARGFYAYATKLPPTEPVKADPGPNRERRQARMDELKNAPLYDEDTVLPAVPLWFKTLADEHAQGELDHLGGGAIATDWGARILSAESRLYDPLSYHYGSVWPLFTGWASLAAYNYGRPHVGYQALMANALLTSQNEQGYVTELLSGDFLMPFGRSSHHQVWSEAMVVTPLVRGLLGLEVLDGGRTLRFAPQLPADWAGVEVRNVRAGRELFNFKLERSPGHLRLSVGRRGADPRAPGDWPQVRQLLLAPAMPCDARLRGISVRPRAQANPQAVTRLDDWLLVARVGDIKRAELRVNNEPARPSSDARKPPSSVADDVAVYDFSYDEGTEVFVAQTMPPPGATSAGLRVLRARAEGEALNLSLEGLAGRTYTLGVRTPKQLGAAAGVRVQTTSGGAQLTVMFDGPPGTYVRRDLRLPLQARTR